MNPAQKMITGFLVISVLVIAVLYGIYLYKQKNSQSQTDIIGYKINSLNETLYSGIIFYYGDTCSHCKLVEDFMKNNSIESKITISQREVYKNKTAGEEMMNLQKLGNLPAHYVGAVPLLYDNKTLYLGDKDIISFLKLKVGIA